MATATTKPQNQWDKKELGALWKRKKASGNENYLTGTLNLKNLGDGFPDKDVPVVIFSNKFKQKDAHPDLRVYLSEKRPAKDAPKKAAPAKAAPAAEAAPAADNDLI